MFRPNHIIDDRYDNQMAVPLYSAVHHHFGTMAAGRAKLQPVARLFQAAKASCLVDGRSPICYPLVN